MVLDKMVSEKMVVDKMVFEEIVVDKMAFEKNIYLILVEQNGS